MEIKNIEKTQAVSPDDPDKSPPASEDTSGTCGPETDTEICFDPGFTVSEVRKRAAAAQKGRLLAAFPRILLFTLVRFLPPALLYVLALTMRSRSPGAAIAIEIIAFALWPVIMWGPLNLGFTAACLDTVRGSGITLRRLFMGFRGRWILKSILSYLIFMLISIVSGTVFLLPAGVCSAFIPQLHAGFAHMLSMLIVILLGLSGMAAASQVFLRTVMMFPLLVDYPDMSVPEAFIISVRGLKGSTKRLLLLLLSYAGWFLAFFGAAAAVIVSLATGAYFMTMMIMHSGDIGRALITFYTALIMVYGISCLLYNAAYSLFVIRPGIGLAAFYDTVTGSSREPSDRSSQAEDDPEICL